MMRFRSENAHAYVNAACYVQVDDQLVVQGTPSLVFGGIADTFVHAVKTEAFITGKKLNVKSLIRVTKVSFIQLQYYSRIFKSSLLLARC